MTEHDGWGGVTQGIKRLDVQLSDIAAVAVRQIGWLQVRDPELRAPKLTWEGWEEHLGTGDRNHALAGHFQDGNKWRYLVIPFEEIVAYELKQGGPARQGPK